MRVMHVSEEEGRLISDMLLSSIKELPRIEPDSSIASVNFIREFCATFGYNYDRVLNEGKFIKPC